MSTIVPFTLGAISSIGFYRFMSQCPHFLPKTIILASLGLFVLVTGIGYLVAQKCQRQDQSSEDQQEKSAKPNIKKQDKDQLQKALENMSHPLDNGEVDIDHKTGCIDYDQFLTLIKFCQKMAEEQLVEPRRDLICARRQALRDGNDEEYENLVYSVLYIERTYQQRVFGHVLTSLNVTKEIFGQSRSTYEADPTKDIVMKSIVKQIRYQQSQPAKGSPEAEILSKKKLMEYSKIMMENEVQKVKNKKNLLTLDQQSVRDAIMEDTILEKTGVELGQYEFSMDAQKLQDDPKYKKMVEETQIRMVEVQLGK